MSIADIVHSESGLTLVGAALGALWTFFKSRDWYQGVRQQRYCRAVQALEAGVEQTYRTYVRAIKDSREDGKLTEAEMRDARSLARQTALEYGRTEGIDVLAELGDAYLDLWTAKLVKRMKKG